MKKLFFLGGLLLAPVFLMANLTSFQRPNFSLTANDLEAGAGSDFHSMITQDSAAERVNIEVGPDEKWQLWLASGLQNPMMGVSVKIDRIQPFQPPIFGPTGDWTRLSQARTLIAQGQGPCEISLLFALTQMRLADLANPGFQIQLYYNLEKSL